MAQPHTHVDKSARARRQARSKRAGQLSHYLFVVPALLYITLTTIYPIVSNLQHELLRCHRHHLFIK